MSKQTLTILKQLVYAEMQAFKGIDNKYINLYLRRLKVVYKQVEKALCQ